MTLNVLLVDDDPLMHLLYRPHLERADYRVLSAATGEEALEISTREALHAIIMDIKLPGVDGLSVLRELRKHQDTKGTPAVVITSVVDYNVCQQEIKAIGGASFLPKPFSPAQLLAEVKRLLGQAVAGASGPQPKQDGR